MVALKMAAEGCLIATPGERFRVPGHRVEAVDATGAGDTFDGAFLTRLLAATTRRRRRATPMSGGALTTRLRRGDAYSAAGRSPAELARA